MIGSLIIIGLLLTLNTIWRPRIDKTKEGEVLLWYGKENRRYKKLW